MSVSTIKRYENKFLFISSFLIAVINTLPFFASIFYSDHGSENSKFNMDDYTIIIRSIWYCLQSFVSILVFAYFNYRWKKYLLPGKAHKLFRFLLIFIYNIILIALLLFLTVKFAGLTIGNPFGEKGAIYYYLYKYLVIYPPALIIAYALAFLTRARIAELENIKLKEENLSSQLKSLRDQINPHFLFNTLNTLSSVIRLDKKSDGLRFVDDLSSVYRYILESDKHELVKLESEIKFLNSYVYMLKKRFDEKLKIDIVLPQTVLSSKVPPMVLQVLVENAIKHNEISKLAPLQIKIFAEENYIVVKNDLREKSDDQNNLGLGLPNLVSRYKLIARKDVIISQTKDSFIVKLPIIKS